MLRKPGMPALLLLNAGFYGVVLGAGLAGGAALLAGFGLVAVGVRGTVRQSRLRFAFVGQSGPNAEVVIRYWDGITARPFRDERGAGVLIPGGGRLGSGSSKHLKLRGPRMRHFLLRLLPHRTQGAASRRETAAALRLLEARLSLDSMLASAADRQLAFGLWIQRKVLPVHETLAMEMALHQQLEGSDQALAEFYGEAARLSVEEPSEPEPSP